MTVNRGRTSNPQSPAASGPPKHISVNAPVLTSRLMYNQFPHMANKILLDHSENPYSTLGPPKYPLMSPGTNVVFTNPLIL